MSTYDEIRDAVVSINENFGEDKGEVKELRLQLALARTAIQDVLEDRCGSAKGDRCRLRMGLDAIETADELVGPKCNWVLMDKENQIYKAKDKGVDITCPKCGEVLEHHYMAGKDYQMIMECAEGHIWDIEGSAITGSWTAKRV